MVKERYSLVRRGVIALPGIGEVVEGTLEGVEARVCALRTKGLNKVPPSEYGSCLRADPDCKYYDHGVCDNDCIASAQRWKNELKYALST